MKTRIFLISLSTCPLRPCENIIKLANQRGCINIYCRLTTAINILEPSTSSEKTRELHASVKIHEDLFPNAQNWYKAGNSAHLTAIDSDAAFH